jgi:hypothetical protein
LATSARKPMATLSASWWWRCWRTVTDCLEASTLVGDHEVNTLPQALKELADAGGWPATTAAVLSNIATTCTRGPKTRTTPAEVLQQVEGAWERRGSSGSWFG